MFSFDFAREESLAQRTEGNEADPEFLECRQHFLFRISRPQRVLALDGGDRLDRVSATNRLRSGLRKAEVLDLAPGSGPLPLPPLLRSVRSGQHDAGRTDR